jgi:hypothetical protein
VKKLTTTKRQHFVPHHYLRQFRFGQGEQVLASRIDPYQHIGSAGIDRQCKEDYFYGDDGVLEDILKNCEDGTAPVLQDMVRERRFDSKQLLVLRLLAVTLHLRTRKMAESAKLLPKKIAFEVIKDAIERGRLPAPSGGFTEDMMDFGGVPGMVIKSTVSCWMEMQTLECKLLQTVNGAKFITSDNPSVIMNEFCARHDSLHSYAGFSRSGFQLILPLSPDICAYFYDPDVYKVGPRRAQLVSISQRDVELVNSLQIQAAEHCVYFHDEALCPLVWTWINKYQKLKLPVSDSLRKYPALDGKSELLHLRSAAVRPPDAFHFWKYRNNIRVKPGDRRDENWTAFLKDLEDDLERNPGGDIFDRMKSILGEDAFDFSHEA